MTIHEIAARLCLSEYAARQLVRLALALTTRFTGTLAALSAGRLDLRRAHLGLSTHPTTIPETHPSDRACPEPERHRGTWSRPARPPWSATAASRPFRSAAPVDRGLDVTRCLADVLVGPVVPGEALRQREHEQALPIAATDDQPGPADVENRCYHGNSGPAVGDGEGLDLAGLAARGRRIRVEADDPVAGRLGCARLVNGRGLVGRIRVREHEHRRAALFDQALGVEGRLDPAAQGDPRVHWFSGSKGVDSRMDVHPVSADADQQRQTDDNGERRG